MSEWKLLAVAFDSIADPVLVHDKDFRILRVNRAVADRLGVPAEALLGHSLCAVLQRNGRPWSQCPYCEGVEGNGEALDPAFGGYLLASVSNFHDPANRTLATVHVLKDVTSHRAAEEKYRTLFENVQEGVFISTPDGRFLDFNDTFQRMMGYDNREDLLSVDIAPTIYVNPAERDRLKQALARDGAVKNFEFQMRRRTGEILTVMESSFATRDATGAITAYQGFVLDITERKRVEREIRQRNEELTRLHQETQAAYQNLRRTQEQLLQSEKMAAIGQLISGVAHELNNPLTAILGYSQLLADGGEVTPHGAEYVGKLQRQAQRTHRIVQNLLSFARQHTPERRPVALNQVLDDTLVLREYDLKLNNIQAHREYDAHLPPIAGDPHQLQQVILNILNNAVDAILEAGDRGEIWMRTWAAEGQVHAEITDSGPGVKDPKRVFDPFFTTKPVGHGTGLGLSICYGIVKEHAGEITVRNVPSRGAAFRISLPGHAAPVERPADTHAPSDAILAARILLVDDEDAVLELEQEILRGRCLWVKAVRSGREALEFLEREPVDLVVTDLKMPGHISGRDLFDWIARHHPDLSARVIFTMSDAQDERVLALLQQTGCPHVQKPFQMEEFLRVVRHVVAQNNPSSASRQNRAGRNNHR